MINRTVIALLATSALVLAACGSDEASSDDTGGGASGGGTAATAADLADTTFELTEVTGYDVVEGSTITLTFSADMVSANAGCNTMNGGYTIADGVLTVAGGASTMIACDEALMAQDTWLAGFLAAGVDATIDGDTLTLAGEDTTMTLAAQQPAALEGTTWTVTGTVATEAISSVPADGVATLTITDGTAAVNTGCNTGSGSVEVTDTTMTFGPIALTRKACPPEITELENAVVAALEGEVTYELSGDTLSIRKAGADGEIGLEFIAG
jgi:heat shock protein HslJ